MSKMVTLGGERLGSGKKMKVELHGFERSTFDLSYIWRSTMAPGTLVPFLSEVGLPGDTFDINLDCDIKTHPTIGPLFGSFKVQLDVFLAPIRLYNSMLHNNMLGIGNNMSQVKLPQIQLIANPLPPDTLNPEFDMDNSQINPSCLLAYFGIRGVGTQQTVASITREFNAIPILAYWEIYKNYYANKQEEIGAVIHTPAAVRVLIGSVNFRDYLGNVTTIPPTGGPVNPIAISPSMIPVLLVQMTVPGTVPVLTQYLVRTVEHGWISLAELAIGQWAEGAPDNWEAAYDSAKWGTIHTYDWKYQDYSDMGQGKPAISTFPLSNIDAMRNNILAFQNNAQPYIIDATVETPYSWLADEPNGIPNMISGQEGLGLKTYQSDLFNNWLQTEWIDGPGGISDITAVDTSAGSFKIDTLILAKKVHAMLNRIAVSGGSYDDWQSAVWDHERHVGAESPMYMGGLIKELVFQEVISNSESGDQALGTLGGRGVMSKKHKGGNITVKVDEPSWILGIISLTPRIDYSQGNKWDIHLKTMDDLHKPSLSQIGFQELITEQMAWWDTEYDSVAGVWVQKSAGKQPAWINYMTNVNRVLGNFAIKNNEMFMVLNRRWEWDFNGGVSPMGIGDLTTYIDPSKFNFIFAETALDAQNFWTQIGVDIKARRKMSSKVMPNL